MPARTGTTDPGGGPGRGGKGAVWILVLAIALVAAVRIHRLGLALERDEGEYAYGAQLILSRAFTYDDFHTMKLPGVPAVYALFLLCFGPTREAIHAGALLVDVAAMGLLFLLGRRLFGPRAGASAAAAYGVLALGQSVFGLYAHAEHFAVLFVLAGALALQRAESGGRLRAFFLAGLSFGVACLMKQQAFPLAGLGLVAVAGSSGPRLARAAVFALGGAAAYAAVALVFLASGSFASFWFWTFTCARAYVERVTVAQGLAYLRESTWGLLREAPLLWLLAGAGAALGLASRTLPRRRLFLAAFAALAFLATCPGLYFRNHYMIFVLPPACLLAGAALERIAAAVAARVRSVTAGVVHGGLLAVACGTTVLAGRDHLLLQSPAEVAHTTFPGNPFHEAIEIARELRQRSAPGDSIAILGSEPEILFYADRRGTTGFIYTYFLMEEGDFGLRMQKEMVAELETKRPRFVVYVNVPSSWGRRAGSPAFVFGETARWLEAGYEKRGVVEVLANGSRFWWDERVGEAKPSSECYLVVYERRS